jgi:ribosomal protein S27AE
MERDINELKEAWKRAADSDVIRAATEDWEGYSPQTHPIIETEARNRGLWEEVLALRETPDLKHSTEFAEIRDIERDVLDHETKKRHDMGTCGRCGATIEIAKERSLGSLGRFVGKSENHFCSNCGIFLRTSPFNAILYGSIEIILICFLFMVVMAPSKSGHTSPAQSIFGLVAFFGILDGGKRLFWGISGVLKAKKEAAKRKKETEKTLKQQKGKS